MAVASGGLGSLDRMHRAPLTNVSTSVQPGPAVTRPEWPPNYFPRPRLVSQLDAAIHGPVTLVSAAAGWGKTVLLSAWARSRPPGRRPVWLTTGPDDVSHLWTTIIDAVDAAGLVDAARVASVTAWAGPGEVADILRTVPAPVVLVLDDFSNVAVPEVIAGIEYLVRTLGGRLRLVLACRSDPPLPLHRWRVNGDLGELRTDQLAFTGTETGE